MKYTREEVMEFVQQEDVRFIRLAFCNVYGRQHNVAIMPSELRRAFEYGIAIDASAIEGFGGETRSDLLLRPDPSTLVQLPWRPEQGKVVRMFCDIFYPDGHAFERDTRSILKRAVADAADAGYRFAFGAEMEFYLFELDEHYVLRPLLADSCTYDAEQRVYTLTLRSGVTFSDGSALTARDVAATLERARQSQRYAARLAEVSSVRAQGDTVRITMSTDLATLAWRLDIPIVKAGTESDTVPVGTGPYVFTASDSGAYLEQNPSWWQQKALPLRRIELLHCKDRDTMLYAFSSREVQLLPLDLTGTGASGVSASGDYTDAPTSVMQFLGFNTRRAPFSDAALRQALSAAADRQALVDSCLLGHGSAAQFPLSPASEEYPTELEAPYSIAALQQLTQEEAGSSDDAANAGNTSSDNASAGMYAGVSVTLLVNEENSFKVSAAQEIAAALSRCGLTVTVDSVPWETYLQRLQDGSFDLYYGECRLTADWDILELVGTEGSLNYGGFSDEDTDVLLAACRTASEGQRSKALTALWQDLLEKMPIAPLCFKSDSVLTTTGLVEGLTATETDPFFSLEQWTVHLDTPQAAK